MNYTKFKLFLLSILWRASISSRPFFNEINLGTHEEVIRKMILQGNAGDIDDYPTVMTTYLNDKTMPKELIAKPRKRDDDGLATFVFMIAGVFYLYYFYVEKEKIQKAILSETIKPNNEMNFYINPKHHNWNLISGFSGFKNLFQ